jgi:hypothetical protein
MTFIPSVLTDTDASNSTASTTTTFTGSIKQTTGYNTLLITLESTQSSTAGGLIIQFSDTNNVADLRTYYTDTYFSGTVYARSFKILKKYYRVSYTSDGSADITLTSRLSTQFDTASSNSSFYYETDDGIFDAFGKLRVTNPYTLLDLKFPGQSIVSGASSEFLKNNVLETNTSSGSFTGTYEKGKCIMTGSGVGYFRNQSRKVAIYQPGKSTLFLASGVIYNGPTGTTNIDYVARLGYFDDTNGLFFGYDSQNGISVNLRKNGTETTVYQSDWNVDKMDGTGQSSLSLDFTKTQLFVIDFEWLGVGRIRFGFYAFGKIYYCHQVTNVNTLTEPYMQTANLPIRYELQGYNALQATPATLVEICATAISEGGYNPIGRPFSASNSSTAISLTNTTETLALAIRINPIYKNTGVVPTGISVISDTQNIVLYRMRLYLNPASPGSLLFNSVNPNSIVQSATTFSSGTLSTTNSIIIDESYFAGKQTTTFSNLGSVFTNLVQLTMDITGVSDILGITCQRITGGSTGVYATINWQELY